MEVRVGSEGGLQKEPILVYRQVLDRIFPVYLCDDNIPEHYGELALHLVLVVVVGVPTARMMLFVPVVAEPTCVCGG